MLNYLLTGKSFNPCIWHAEHGDKCHKYIIAKFFRIFKAMSQINIPIHVLPFLIFKLKSIRKE